MITYLRSVWASGSTLYQNNPAQFWTSLLHIPRFILIVLFGHRERLMSVMATRVMKLVAEKPLGAEGEMLFRARPKQMTLAIAYQATLSLWFAPATHFETITMIAPKMLRYWQWQTGATIEDDCQIPEAEAVFTAGGTP